MRILATAIVVAPLVLIGAPGAAVAQSNPPADTGSATDWDTYTQQAQGKSQEWQQKLQHFSDTMAAKGQKATTRTEDQLKKAWARTQTEAHKQTATADGWQGAKTSFERASRDLSNAWGKIRPQDR